MNATSHRLRGHNRLRVVWSILLGLALLASALAPAEPARAAPRREIDRRVQIVVKSITVIDDHEDDRDTNGGELTFRFTVREVVPGCPPFLPLEQCQVPTLVDQTFRLPGSDGDIIVLDEAIPSTGSTVDQTDRRIDAGIGIPLFADESYALRIVGQERDLGRFEGLGAITLHLTPQNDWLRGEHRIRASTNEGQTSNGDFIVVLEVRDTPLPDLRPVGLKIVDGPGADQHAVCVDVVNAGAWDAAQVALVFQDDDNGLADGQTPAEKLRAGERVEVCVPITPLTAGSHRVTVFVDEKAAVEEVSDTNNSMSIPYVAPAPGTDPSPPPAPSPMPMPSPTPDTALPDLTGAIKVNGQEPDGKDDCKPGKNTVSVVVTNSGTANAGTFAVRLTVGGLNEKPGQTVKGLAAGQEREVRFENVRLKKGEHLISASLDAEGEVAESNEDNNEPKATARCKDDD